MKTVGFVFRGYNETPLEMHYFTFFFNQQHSETIKVPFDVKYLQMDEYYSKYNVCLPEQTLLSGSITRLCKGVHHDFKN